MKIAWFGDLTKDQVHIAGGKGASLSEMVRADLPVPPGFIICSDAYQEVIERNNLRDKVLALVKSIDVENNDRLESESATLREMIKEAVIPDNLKKEIVEAYRRLSGDTEAYVAVRSSATMEDLSDASFAGQQDTFLYVSGEEEVLKCVSTCWASLYNSRVVYYRRKKGLKEEDLSIAVVIQKMIDSDKSGVMFTVNPITKDKDSIVIEAVWGLGEGIVSGLITPDNYILDKRNNEVISCYVSKKEVMVVRGASGWGTEEKEVEPDLVNEQVLTEKEMVELLNLGKKLEDMYGTPQDVEWGIERGTLHLLQSRPITTL